MSDPTPGQPDAPEDNPAAGAVRRVTLNQVIAYNLTFWRKTAGLTQEELGERLGGWSNAAVSAAERSWDGKRIRKFDADEIAEIATVLGVPIAALLLPPSSEPDEPPYVITGDHGHDLSMEDLLRLILPPGGESTPMMTAYLTRLQGAVMFHIGGLWQQHAFSEYLSDMVKDTERDVWIERIRWQQAALESVMLDLMQASDELHKRSRAGEAPK